jgi:hypothetical protein
MNLDYSRVEVDLVVRLGRRKASAHEDVVKDAANKILSSFECKFGSRFYE